MVLQAPWARTSRLGAGRTSQHRPQDCGKRAECGSERRQREQSARLPQSWGRCWAPGHTTDAHGDATGTQRANVRLSLRPMLAPWANVRLSLRPLRAPWANVRLSRPGNFALQRTGRPGRPQPSRRKFSPRVRAPPPPPLQLNPPTVV
eukprot:gene11535-biopygen9038